MDWYTILSQEMNEDEYKFSVKVDDEHPIFKGHFPQHPIVPGALFTQIVRDLIEVVYKRSLTLEIAKSIKFLHPIVPSKSCVLDFTLIAEQTEVISVKGVGAVEGKMFFKIEAIYKDSF